MSSAYDPRRSRPRPAAAPDPEAAPIDALLGPEPASDQLATETPASPLVESGGPVEPSRPAPPPIASPARRAGSPSFLAQLAPLLVGVAAVAAVVWWITRRRSSD